MKSGEIWKTSFLTRRDRWYKGCSIDRGPMHYIFLLISKSVKYFNFSNVRKSGNDVKPPVPPPWIFLHHTTRAIPIDQFPHNKSKENEDLSCMVQWTPFWVLAHYFLISKPSRARQLNHHCGITNFHLVIYQSSAYLKKNSHLHFWIEANKGQKSISET